MQRIQARTPCLQPMLVAWVDNPRSTMAKVKANLGVEVVLNDALHALMLPARTIPDDHSLKGKACLSSSGQ